MRVPMPKRLMPMPMRMRLRHHSVVGVLVVFVVDMSMFVLDRVVRMLVAMSFGQMKPETERHKPTGDDQLSRHRLAYEDDRDHRAKERGEREIGARAGAAEMTQRRDKQHETHPDAKESDEQRRARRADRVQASAKDERHGQVYASSCEALDQRDDDGIRGRKFRATGYCRYPMPGTRVRSADCRHRGGFPCLPRTEQPRPRGWKLRRAGVSDRRSPERRSMQWPWSPILRD